MWIKIKQTHALGNIEHILSTRNVVRDYYEKRCIRETFSLRILLVKAVVTEEKDVQGSLMWTLDIIANIRIISEVKIKLQNKS